MTLEELGAIVRATVVRADRPRWGFSPRTWLVETADGRRLAVQLLRGATGAHRVRVARDVAPRLAAVGIPAPSIVAADPAARPAFLVSVLVEGSPGPDVIDEPTAGVALGRGMGRLGRLVASVSPAGLRMSRRWSDAHRLAAAAGGWLERVAAALELGAFEEVKAIVGRLPVLFAGRPAVLAHGDWTPANVLVANGRVSAVLDWEFARLADPLFDAAQFRGALVLFHPARLADAWPAYLEGAALAPDRTDEERLRAFAALRIVETMAGHENRRSRSAGRLWADRLSRILAAP